jgi:glycosyltransferase involved in cell wall biosynthesis
MHLGKAIIVTDSTGVGDYVRDGDNALLSEFNSPTDLAERIRRLWEDPLLCDTLGKNGNRFAACHCSEESMKSHLRHVLSGYFEPITESATCQL